MWDRVRKPLTTSRVASLLNVSNQAVVNWINRGILRSDKTPGGHRRIDPIELRDFLKERNLRIPKALMRNYLSILIVDDDPSVTESLREEIGQLMPLCRIITANDGYRAGESVATEDPDIVILDLYMPGLNGFEVCRRIKSNPVTADIRVIAITSFPSIEAESEIREAGACCCLAKPVTAGQLLAILTPTPA